jgi:hypothetical protein
VDAELAAARKLLRHWRACAERKQTPDGWQCHADAGQAAHELELAMARATQTPPARA